MAAFSEDFLRFLRANYPDEFRRASVNDVKEDVVNSIMSRHANHYAIWQRIPEWVKNRYADKIPVEVLSGLETPEDFTQKEIEHFTAPESIRSAAVETAAMFLAIGFSSKSSAKLSEQRAYRAQLLDQAGDDGLTDAMMSLWLESRKTDMMTIENDWKTNQPEKYVLHLAKALSRKKISAQKAGGADKQTTMEIAALERELGNYMQKFQSKKSKKSLVDYLRKPSRQSALYHLSSEVLPLFAGLLSKQGIKIEANPDKIQNMRLNSEQTGGLTNTLRGDFDKMVKRENLLVTAATQGEQLIKRISPTNLLGKKQKDGVEMLVRTKKRSRKQNSA